MSKKEEQRQHSLIKARLIEELNRLLSYGFDRKGLAEHFELKTTQMDNDLAPLKTSIPTAARLAAMSAISERKAKDIAGFLSFDLGYIMQGVRGMSYDRAQYETNQAQQKEIARLHAELSRAKSDNERLSSELEGVKEGVRKAGSV